MKPIKAVKYAFIMRKTCRKRIKWGLHRILSIYYQPVCACGLPETSSKTWILHFHPRYLRDSALLALGLVFYASVIRLFPTRAFQVQVCQSFGFPLGKSSVRSTLNLGYWVWSLFYRDLGWDTYCHIKTKQKNISID